MKIVDGSGVNGHAHQILTMATEDTIPVVDLSGVLSSQDLASCPQVQQLHSAFTKVGFVFIKNHGIRRKLVITSDLAAVKLSCSVNKLDWV